LSDKGKSTLSHSVAYHIAINLELAVNSNHYNAYISELSLNTACSH